MTRKAGWVFLVVFLCFALLAGAGCSKNDAGKASVEAGQTGALQRIIITEPTRGHLWAPIYVAHTLGYFQEAGLDAEFQTVTGGDPSAPVLAGEAQFGLRGVETPITIANAGKEVKILLSTTQKFPFAFIAQGPKYTTIQSLKGQTIAGSNPGGSLTAFIRACIAYGGLDPKTDVNIPNMQYSAFLAAMKNGDVAACCGTNGYIIKNLMANGGVMLVDGRDTQVFKNLMGSETYEMYIMFATDKYIKENPETVQKVVNASARGLQWMDSHSAEEIVEALLPLFPDRKDELLVSVGDSKQNGEFSANGKHTESGYKAALQLNKLAGIITQDIPADKVYDETFLDNAWKQLGK